MERLIYGVAVGVSLFALLSIAGFLHKIAQQLAATNGMLSNINLMLHTRLEEQLVEARDITEAVKEIAGIARDFEQR